MTSCIIHPLPYQADPAIYFAQIRQAHGAVLFDAGRPHAERGRFDVLSAWPKQSFEPAPEETGLGFFQRLRSALNTLGQAQLPETLELPFAGGLLGYLSYDFGRRLEQLPTDAIDDLQLPHARLGLYTWALISDHQLGSSQLVFHPSVEVQRRAQIIEVFTSQAASNERPFKLTQAFSNDLSAHAYQQAIERIQAYIQAGDCYQVNFAQRFQAPCQGDPWSAYQALRRACPTPFSAFIALDDDDAILSLSPERFIAVCQDQVETRPIKGTRPRATEPEQDQANARALLNSAKDRAENLMIVDLLRNDLGRNCRIGSVKVPQLFALESYPNVHHLVSAVTGELAEGRDPLDLISGSFPGGSITGAPKIRAMQIIDELEPTQRAIYCGSMLYWDVRGEFDSSITIRSLLVKDGKISCWGGGGIVADSNWQDEYAESLTKVRVLLETLEAL